MFLKKFHNLFKVLVINWLLIVPSQSCFAEEPKIFLLKEASKLQQKRPLQKFKEALVVGKKYAEYGEYMGIGSSIALVLPFTYEMTATRRRGLIFIPLLFSLCKVGCSALLLGCQLFDKEERKRICSPSSFKETGLSLLPSIPGMLHICAALIRVFTIITMEVKKQNEDILTFRNTKGCAGGFGSSFVPPSVPLFFLPLGQKYKSFCKINES
jgi:hypothetical protein